MSDELKIKKETILEMAKSYPETKQVLKKLFPEVFKEKEFIEESKYPQIVLTDLKKLERINDYSNKILLKLLTIVYGDDWNIEVDDIKKNFRNVRFKKYSRKKY